MTPAARISAAIEILADLETRRRPAADAAKDWGQTHRFAGSKDRAAIAALVFDALRVRASSAFVMQDESARGVMLGALHESRGLDADAIAALCNGEGHAPALLSESERARLDHPSLDGAPDHVRGNYPEWLAPHFAAAFGETAVAEGTALSRRAPVDLRCNTLKASREKAEAALAHLNGVQTPMSPWGLRIAIGADGRAPALGAEPSFVKGHVEIQDEASQIASLFTQARAGEQVLDLCAGGGGKALAMAAMMDNRGQIYASDTDGRRLMAILPRIDRANARNIQLRAPRGQTDVLSGLEQRCDLVLVDAPCTGIGTWRRNPDAKWRVRPGALEQRITEQDEALARAAPYVKSGGRLVYVTCSLLRDENEDRVAAFLKAHPDFVAADAAEIARAIGLDALADRVSIHGPGLRLTPATTHTDGFYMVSLTRN